MMTMQLDLTAQLAAITYGMAITLGVSFLGILAYVSRDEVTSLVETYRHYRAALRRRQIRLVSPLQSATNAH